MEWKEDLPALKKWLHPAKASSLGALFLGALMLTACGDVNLETQGYKDLKAKLKSEIKSEVIAELTGGQVVASKPVQQAVVSSSSCVTCHTDTEKLKFETAGIKAPPKSAMTSGKG